MQFSHIITKPEVPGSWASSLQWTQVSARWLSREVGILAEERLSGWTTNLVCEAEQGAGRQGKQALASRDVEPEAERTGASWWPCSARRRTRPPGVQGGGRTTGGRRPALPLGQRARGHGQACPFQPKDFRRHTESDLGLHGIVGRCWA
jgi:hypothetical protein